MDRAIVEEKQGRAEVALDVAMTTAKTGKYVESELETAVTTASAWLAAAEELHKTEPDDTALTDAKRHFQDYWDKIWNEYLDSYKEKVKKARCAATEALLIAERGMIHGKVETNGWPRTQRTSKNYLDTADEWRSAVEKWKNESVRKDLSLQQPNDADALVEKIKKDARYYESIREMQYAENYSEKVKKLEESKEKRRIHLVHSSKGRLWKNFYGHYVRNVSCK